MNWEIDPLIEWTCGHTATSMCSECHRELSLKAHMLQLRVYELEELIARLKEEKYSAQS